MANDADYLKDLQVRLNGMNTERYSWWVHWRELAEFILPRRYTWLVTANQMRRGQQLNNKIIDSTGTIAARTCASGMMAGITSPSRPWFKLRIAGYNNNDEDHPVSIWLADCERLMMRVFAESNFYTSIAVMYLDLAVFGTASMLIYEDYEDVIRCYNPSLGEFYLENNSRLEADVFARKILLKATQMRQQFGEENLSQSARNLLKTNQGGSNAITDFTVCHIILPNTGQMAPQFRFCEYYWEEAGNNGKFLLKRGFFEQPALCPRWDTSGNDAYGRSPGMDALGDIKQLQQETKRKAQAIDKMTNPPLQADVMLKNQPASQLPGGITYVASQSQVGIKPIFTVMPPVQELMLDIQEIQLRIQKIFFNDLFMMISQLQTVRSATEIDARREEKLIMLGPVLERFHNEALDKAVDRVFNIMARGRLLPPPPREIQGRSVEVQYTSMLAEAQRVSSTASIERLLATTGNLVGVQPDIMDNVDTDEAIATYGDLLSVPPKIIREREAVMELRKARAAQNQQAQALEATMGLSKAAQNLSNTDVGGGNNALASIMGGP